MTLPARDRPGKLGTLGLTGAGQVEFQDYRPRPGASETVIVINSDVNATLDAFRIGRDNNAEHSIAAAVAVTAGTELRQSFAFPLNQVRTRLTLSGAGQATVEADDSV